MEKTKIDWADYSWNPVIGCLHGCEYCYAAKWAKRSGQSFKPHRSKQWGKPFKILAPSTIFVCSLADLFGDWVHDDWIEDVISICRSCPEHNFMFLTKNPKRYREFTFPENCWLGATVTGESLGFNWPDDLVGDPTLHMWDLPNKKFLSIEPLLGGFYGHLWEYFDLVIVGAMTGGNAIKPKKEWIDSIKHRNIFYKENIKKYLRV